MLEFLQSHVLETLYAALIALLGGAYHVLRRKVVAQKREYDQTCEGVKALLHDRIYTISSICTGHTGHWAATVRGRDCIMLCRPYRSSCRERMILKMDEFFSWEMLGSFAGAAAATGIVTQAVKGIFQKIPTQLVSYVIAVVILGVATTATGGTPDWTGWALVPLNAVVVSLASNGGFEAIKRMSPKNENT